MLISTEYEFVAELSQSKDAIIYRVIRLQDKAPVILKLLRKDYPTPHDIARFQREFAITKKIAVDGVIDVYSLIKYENRYAIVVEDFGATSLNILLKQEQITFEKRLSLAVRLSGVLGTIHTHNVIHKDINLSNIVWEPEKDIVKIIDFGISTELSRETQELLNPSILEGTLPYMSPEQTGRMNRDLDYRTDLYSFGVTLYELFTGQLPFPAKDPLELVHAHIAHVPSPPSAISPEIPPPLSNIIQKLLAKSAEDRYQSAWSLKKDLENCYIQLRENKQILPFRIAENDIPDKFQIPQKLYGREQERMRILASFDDICKEGKELILVAGYSGIGKSSVIHELHKPIVEKHGFFISGKFDQFNANTPYSALIQAFQELIRQILTEEEEVILGWKRKLLNAVSSNGQLIIDVIPETELIIGKQPPLPDLPATEAQNRFNIVFQNFVGVFARKERPLTIFLDDLQWADNATLQFIQLLISDDHTRNLLLICSYRDNEVSPSHPFALTVDEIKKSGAPVTEIHLAPLTVSDISQMLCDILYCKNDESIPLSEMIHKKTSGNPFFINQLLMALHSDGYFLFNTQDFRWEWDLSEFENVSVTDNVIDLMIGKINKLPSEVKEILTIASCVGNRFDVSLLATVVDRPLVEILDNIWTTAKEGLVFPISSSRKFFVEMENNVSLHESNKSLTISGNNLVYRFLHDRVQQAAYSLLTEERKKHLHLHIAERLYNSMTQDELEEQIFELVNHFNVGIALIEDPVKKLLLAQLNLNAAMKARNSSAFSAALNHLRIGSSLLGKTSWKDNYNLTYQMYRERSECEYFNGHFEKAEEIFALVLQHADTNIKKADISDMRMRLYISSGRFPEAIDVGVKALAMLGEKITKTPTALHFLKELLANKLLLRKHKIEDIFELPPMENQEKAWALNIMTNIAPAAYITGNKNLYALVDFRAANLSIRYGNTDFSPFVYAMVGVIYSCVLNEIDTGYKYGEMGVALLDKSRNASCKAKTYFMFSSMVNHWKRHLRKSVSIAKEGYRASLECGDLMFACYNGFRIAVHMFLAGEPLNDVITEAKRFHEHIDKSGDQNMMDNAEMWSYHYKELSETLPEGAKESLDAARERMERSAFNTGLCDLHLNAGRVAYLTADYKKAKKELEEAERKSEAVLGMFEYAEISYWTCLALLALYPDATPTEKVKYLSSIKKHRKQLKHWADSAESNFLHKYQLVCAEYDKAVEKGKNALELYNQAANNARDNEYLNDTAIIHERAFSYCLGEGLSEYASLHLRNAYYYYRQWGAALKVRELEDRFPELKSRLQYPLIGDDEGTLTVTQQESKRGTTTSSTTVELDISSILKSTRAISGEIRLNRLLESLMRIVMENAGARNGSLILENNGQFHVEAEKPEEADEVLIELSLPLEQSQSIAKSIVHLALRTNENIVIDNAAEDNRFSNDPYIVRKKPRSVLCIPFSNRGKLVGIMYLENNLTSGAFTGERLEIMKVLTGQIAASLENAKLYRDLNQVKEQLEEYSHTLEEKVDARTTELQQALVDLKLSQEKLVLAEKMASLGELVAGVAHEINTPIGVCVTSASHLIDSTRDFKEAFEKDELRKSTLQLYVENAGKCSDIILRNLKRTAELIKSFKLVAVDQTNYEQREFDLTAYLGDIILSLSPELKRTRIEVDVQTDPELLIKSYPGAIAQVLTNFVMNSLKHAYEPGEQGKITIEAREVNKQIKLIYRDDGKGIPADSLKKIYNPFYTTKRAQGGTGLGLHIVYNSVVQSLKGTITCESKVGKGTTFTVTFPMK